MDLNFISKKLQLISKLNNFNINLLKNYEKLVNKLNLNFNVNESDINCVKISLEYNAFDMNEDKQRQCYKQLKCFWPKCRYSCEKVSILNIHVFHHLNKRQFVCEECNKQFHRKSNVLIHKRIVHSTDRPFVCNQINCNKTFKTKSKLTQHKSTHSSVKSFGCNKCDKTFKTNSNLRCHKKFVHTNIRPFVCPRSDCNKTFKRKSELTLHNSRHSSVKSFECNKCDKRFKTNPDLSDHKNFVHTNIRPFVCPRSDCNQSFKQRSGLRYHEIRFHNDIKCHKCFHKNCDKSFVTSSGLKHHIVYKHSTERPFQCDLNNCNSSFKSPGNLYKHKKRVHFKNDEYEV